MCLKVTTHFSSSSHQFNRGTCRSHHSHSLHDRSHSRPQPPSCHTCHVHSHRSLHVRSHSQARRQPPSCRICHVRSHHSLHVRSHSQARPQPPSSRGGSSHQQRRERYRQESHRRRGQHTRGHKHRGRHRHGRHRRGEQRSHGILHRRGRRPQAQPRPPSCRICHVRSRGLRNLHGHSHSQPQRWQQPQQRRGPE